MLPLAHRSAVCADRLEQLDKAVLQLTDERDQMASDLSQWQQESRRTAAELEQLRSQLGEFGSATSSVVDLLEGSDGHLEAKASCQIMTRALGDMQQVA